MVRPVVSTRSRRPRLLVRRGDAGELRDLAAPGLGVEPLAVAALALLQRRGDVDEEERAAGVLDHRADVLPGRVERRDRAAHRDPAVPRDLGGDPADPADVGLAVLAEKVEAGREVPAHDVAVQAGDGALARLEQAVDQGPGERGLAAAGQAGEEQHQALRGRRRAVGVDDLRRSVGVARRRPSSRASTGSRPAYAATTWTPARGRSPVVVRRSGTATTHGVGDWPPRPAWRAAAPTGESSGVPVPTRASRTTGPSAGELLELTLGERVDDRDECGRRAARASAGVRCSRRNGPYCGVASSASTSPPGRRPGPAAAPRGRPARPRRRPRSVRGQRQRHRAAGPVEPVERRQRPAGEQLEVVELTRAWGSAAARAGSARSLLPEGP